MNCTARCKLAIVAATASIAVLEGAAHAQTYGCAGPNALTDNQAYASGSYLTWLAPWNKGDLVLGRDYTECASYNPATYPSGQTLKWNWPNRPPGSGGVYGFLSVNYGNYYNTTTPTSIPPRSVQSIRTLTQSFTFTKTGDDRYFNVIDDFFLTAEPSDFSQKLFEVEIFLHISEAGLVYSNLAKPIGTFHASGILWNVSVDTKAPNGPDILIRPADSSDVTVASLDIRALLNFLVGAGVLSGREYFNGLGMGVEPVQGSGQLFIERLSTTYN